MRRKLEFTSTSTKFVCLTVSRMVNRTPQPKSKNLSASAEVYCNYFIVNKSVHSVMTLGKVMICIFIISRNQLAKELFSILEVFSGIE